MEEKQLYQQLNTKYPTALHKIMLYALVRRLLQTEHGKDVPWQTTGNTIANKNGRTVLILDTSENASLTMEFGNQVSVGSDEAWKKLKESNSIVTDLFPEHTMD